jgi:hypothetical protein
LNEQNFWHTRSMIVSVTYIGKIHRVSIVVKFSARSGSGLKCLDFLSALRPTAPALLCFTYSLWLPPSPFRLLCQLEQLCRWPLSRNSQLWRRNFHKFLSKSRHRYDDVLSLKSIMRPIDTIRRPSSCWRSFDIPVRDALRNTSCQHTSISDNTNG